jgi:hypothetical protein
MRRILLALSVVLPLALTPVWGQASKSTDKTDAQIKQEIIRASIASYSGNCPCPYNRDRAGRSCGRRSAYSRPGGASPLCYERDVTQKMVDEYRKRTKQERPLAEKPESSKR